MAKACNGVSGLVRTISDFLFRPCVVALRAASTITLLTVKGVRETRVGSERFKIEPVGACDDLFIASMMTDINVIGQYPATSDPNLNFSGSIYDPIKHILHAADPADIREAMICVGRLCSASAPEVIPRNFDKEIKEELANTVVEIHKEHASVIRNLTRQLDGLYTELSAADIQSELKASLISKVLFMKKDVEVEPDPFEGLWVTPRLKKQRSDSASQ